MVEAYKKMWVNAFDFKGRTNRTDFWYAILANFLVGFILGIASGILGDAGTMLSGIYTIAVLIPGLSIEIRRLHDVNKSGWYLLMSLIPIVGAILVLIAYLSPSVEPNKYN